MFAALMVFISGCGNEKNIYETDFSSKFSSPESAFLMYDYNNRYFILHNKSLAEISLSNSAGEKLLKAVKMPLEKLNNAAINNLSTDSLISSADERASMNLETQCSNIVELFTNKMNDTSKFKEYKSILKDTVSGGSSIYSALSKASGDYFSYSGAVELGDNLYVFAAISKSEDIRNSVLKILREVKLY